LEVGLEESDVVDNYELEKYLLFETLGSLMGVNAWFSWLIMSGLFIFSNSFNYFLISK